MRKLDEITGEVVDAAYKLHTQLESLTITFLPPALERVGRVVFAVPDGLEVSGFPGLIER